jgi:hypothetical protein
MVTTGLGLVTVTVKPQLVDWLPEASVAVQVTAVVPTGNAVPDAGVQEVVTPGQLSLAVGEKVTMAEQTPTPAIVEMLDGQAMVGFSLSLTVTLNEQLAVLPLVSVAVQLTGVVPFGKEEPDDGVQATVTPGQLSFAVAE